MTKTEKKPDADALTRMLRSIEADPLRPETPSELVDEELRAAGGDPERIRSEGAAFAKKLIEQRRATLAARARADLEARRAAAARAPRISRESRGDLLAMLAAVQQNPRYAGQVTAMFRKRTVAEASNEELAVLLEEIEAARLADDDDGGKLNLARTTCTDAILLARRVLRLAGVRGPEDIDVPLIAFDYGICSIPKRLPGHEGNLVRLGTSARALVAIEESAFGTPRGSFTLGHELAHHLMEPGRPLALACFEQPRTADYFRGERRADVFSVELNLPEAFVRALCEGADATLAFLRSLAARFRASLTATALRFVDFSPLPCAVVLTRGGRILRHAATDAFPLPLVKGFAVGPAAFAFAPEILALHEGAGRAERVRGDQWSRAAKARRMDLVEHSTRLGPGDTVLTLLTP